MFVLLGGHLEEDSSMELWLRGEALEALACLERTWTSFLAMTTEPTKREAAAQWIVQFAWRPSICRTSAESWKGVSVSGEGSSHFSDLSVELRGSQTTGSSHLSDIRIELTQSPIIESSSESDIGIELRENQRVGSRSRSRSTHLNDAGVELEDGQANTVGNQLSSDPSPSLDV